MTPKTMDLQEVALAGCIIGWLAAIPPLYFLPHWVFTLVVGRQMMWQLGVGLAYGLCAGAAWTPAFVLAGAVLLRNNIGGEGEPATLQVAPQQGAKQ